MSVGGALTFIVVRDVCVPLAFMKGSEQRQKVLIEVSRGALPFGSFGRCSSCGYCSKAAVVNSGSDGCCKLELGRRGYKSAEQRTHAFGRKVPLLSFLLCLPPVVVV